MASKTSSSMRASAFSCSEADEPMTFWASEIPLRTAWR